MQVCLTQNAQSPTAAAACAPPTPVRRPMGDKELAEPVPGIKADEDDADNADSGLASCLWLWFWSFSSVEPAGPAAAAAAADDDNEEEDDDDDNDDNDDVDDAS